MACPEKVLEVKIMEVGYLLLRPPSSVKDLLALLDRTESLLSRVEQSPSPTMSASMLSATKALVSKQIFRHQDKDIRLGAASCISEITRITAPDTPYDDDLMKEVFQRIVEAFEKLDDMTSESYPRRVSILETVAKVRSCVVMLDLECDELILQMFHHFLRTIGYNDSEYVFSSMETIMTLVIEESEDIPSELLSCLLASVKEDNKDVLPATRKLAEKVFINCGTKLKPYLLDAVNLTGSSLSDYSDIVASVCRDKSEALDHVDLVDSRSHLVSEILEPEAGYPKGVDKSRNSVMSIGAVLLGNGDSTVEATSQEQMSDKLKSEAVKVDNTSDCNVKNVRNHKSSSSAQLTEEADGSQMDSDNMVPNRRRGQVKEAEPSTCSERETQGEAQPPLHAENGAAHDTLLKANGDLPEAARLRRSRHPGSKTQVSKDGMAVMDSSKGDSRNDGRLDEGAVSPKNDVNSAGNSEVKLQWRSGKKLHVDNSDDGGTPATDNLSKNDGDVSNEAVEDTKRTGKKGGSRRLGLDGLSGKRKSNIVPQKRKTSLGTNESVERSLKEMSRSHKAIVKAPSKNQSHLDESAKTKSRRKRSRRAREEAPEIEDDKEQLDERLVGSKIKVWWPDDKLFYEGQIEAFDPATKKHKVVYRDGDVEILLLKNEQYELIEGDAMEDEGQDEHTPSPSGRSEVRQVKQAKISNSVLPRNPTKDAKEKSAGKSKGKSRSGGKGSTNKQGSDTRRGRRSKGSAPNVTSQLVSSVKSKEKPATKIQESTTKIGAHEEEHQDKSMDDSLETSSAAVAQVTKTKVKEGAPAKSGSKLKDTVSKTSAETTNAKKSETAGNSYNEVVDTATGLKNADKDTPKTGRKPRNPMASISSKSKVNSNSSTKGESKVKQTNASADSDNIQEESVSARGKKRRRKGHR